MQKRGTRAGTSIRDRNAKALSACGEPPLPALLGLRAGDEAAMRNIAPSLSPPLSACSRDDLSASAPPGPYAVLATRLRAPTKHTPRLPVSALMLCGDAELAGAGGGLDVAG